MRRAVNRHFVALTFALCSYAAGTIANILASSLHGGWMPTGHEAAPLYWLGDRFQIIGAHPGYTRWASAGDFLIWGGELAVVMVWAVWGFEIAARVYAMQRREASPLTIAKLKGALENTLLQRPDQSGRVIDAKLIER